MTRRRACLVCGGRYEVGFYSWHVVTDRHRRALFARLTRTPPRERRPRKEARG